MCKLRAAKDNALCVIQFARGHWLPFFFMEWSDGNMYEYGGLKKLTVRLSYQENVMSLMHSLATILNTALKEVAEMSYNVYQV